MILENGMLVADRYEVLEEIGTGGMSDVYKAKDHTLGRCVALKVLKAEFSQDMNFVTKFRTEAKAAAGLEHPNIVNVYDVGSENGFYYIVMEYVEGITLKTYIEKKGQLKYREALSISIQVAKGIEAAHAKQIIHRDIKPQNIMISQDGKVKVTDFGIARAVTEHTIPSDVMGSVHYASPEQARNGYVSNRSDIYSLGIVMYEMVTGRVPFDGESTVAVAIQHLQDEMVAPSTYAPDLPISLEKIILKCTQKNPDRRYASIESLLADLRQSLQTPDEDFVQLVPFQQDKTRIVSAEEVQQIKKAADAGQDAGKLSDKEDVPVKKKYREDDYEDDFDPSEYDEDEDEKAGRADRIVKIMMAVIGVLIAMIVLYIVLSFFGVIHFRIGGNKAADNQTSAVSEEQAETFEMPEITGLTVEEATNRLSDYDITVNVASTETSEDVEEGKIISQDPLKGASTAVGSTVNVVVSGGAEEVEVPSVTKDTTEAAMATLEDLGFVVSREFEYSSSAATGTVLSQEPKAGTKAAKGSTVKIIISQGSETAKVPDVRGMSEADATAQLQASGFTVNTTTESSETVESGKVISQDPAAGKFADVDSVINLVISSGPAESTYSCRATINAPSDTTVEYADIEVYYGDSDDLIQSWANVTSFPYSLQMSGVKVEGVSSATFDATVVITWHYKDSTGSLQSYTQDDSMITFYKE